MIPDGLQDVAVVAALNSWDPDAVADAKRDRGELTLIISPGKILETCRHLKHEQQFARLSGITAVDCCPTEPRFEVVYHLHALEKNERLRLKCRVDGEQPEIASVTGVWRNANWYEREIFDLFGIIFPGHPNLRRILLPEEWEGYPLRKDFPVHGYKHSYRDEQ